MSEAKIYGILMIFFRINYVSTVKEGIIVFYGDNQKLLDKNFKKYRQKLEKEERKVIWKA